MNFKSNEKDKKDISNKMNDYVETQCAKKKSMKVTAEKDNEDIETAGAGHKGLVQKKVTVNKGGKTFQRTQWVKAGEDPKAQKKTAQPETKAVISDIDAKEVIKDISTGNDEVVEMNLSNLSDADLQKVQQINNQPLGNRKAHSLLNKELKIREIQAAKAAKERIPSKEELEKAKASFKKTNQAALAKEEDKDTAMRAKFQKEQDEENHERLAQEVFDLIEDNKNMDANSLAKQMVAKPELKRQLKLNISPKDTVANFIEGQKDMMEQ